MKRYLTVGIAAVFLLLSVAATAGAEVPVKAQTLAAEMGVEAMMTPEAMRVAEAIGICLERPQPTGRVGTVLFTLDAVRPRADARIVEGGFRLGNVVIYEGTDLAPDGSQRRVAGALIHRDILGREIVTSFSADYAVRPDGGINVGIAATKPHTRLQPKVLVVFVPKNRLPAGFPEGLSMTDACRMILNRGARMDGLRGTDRTTRDYRVFALFLNRLPDGARVGLAACDGPEAPGDSAGSMAWSEDGWHIAALDDTFAIDGTRDRFFRPEYSLDGRNFNDCGVFSSRSLVWQIQEALLVRGYDPGTLDGRFGKRTERAIRAFERDRRLPESGMARPALLTELLYEVDPAAMMGSQEIIPASSMPTGLPAPQAPDAESRAIRLELDRVIWRPQR